MRVAAVQLNSTADRRRTCASADRLTRAAAADGATLIVLPEKWTAMGSDEDQRARPPRRSRGRPIEWARATARELGVDLVAGSILELLPGREKLANTSRARRSPRARSGPSTARSTCSTSRSAGSSYRESDLEEPGEEIVLSQTADGRRAGPVDLLRPALSRALPHPRRARRPRDRAPVRLHARHHPRPLGDAAAGPRDREPGVHDRRQPGRRATRPAITRAGAR